MTLRVAWVGQGGQGGGVCLVCGWSGCGVGLGVLCVVCRVFCCGVVFVRTIQKTPLFF